MAATAAPPSPGHSSLLADILTLRTGGSRLLVFALLSVLIYVAPYQWLAHLSLWKALGWHSAPSIGLTRAYWLLLHTHAAAAWHRNHFIYLVLLVGLPLLGRDLYVVIRDRRRRNML